MYTAIVTCYYDPLSVKQEQYESSFGSRELVLVSLVAHNSRQNVIHLISLQILHQLVASISAICTTYIHIYYNLSLHPPGFGVLRIPFRYTLLVYAWYLPIESSVKQ